MNGDTDFTENGSPMLVALTPKLPAALSIVGSYVLIREISMELRSSSPGSSSRPLLRAVLAMSISDIVFSIPYVITTWAAPADLDYGFLWGNVGTVATCDAQGFLLQFGMQSSPLFNFLQAFFSLLMVRYSWSDTQIRRIEPWLHGLVWIYSFAASVFALPLGLYNSNILVCYFGSHPIGCKDSLTYGDEADCTRGDNAWVYAIVFVFFPLWFCIIGGFVCMLLMYLSVRREECRISKYASSSRIVVDANTSFEGGGTIRQVVPRDKSRAVAKQAYWYMGAFLFVNSLNAVNSPLFFAKNIYNEMFDVFTYALVPLQGLLNFMVFCRPRGKMKSPEGRFLRWMLFYGAEEKFRQDARTGNIQANRNQRPSGDDLFDIEEVVVEEGGSNSSKSSITPQITHNANRE